LLGLSITSIFAAPGDVSLQANKQIVAGVVLQLKGQVEIVFDKLVIVADEADFNVVTGDLEARGNVRGAADGKSLDASPVADKLSMNSKSPKTIVLTMHSR